MNVKEILEGMAARAFSASYPGEVSRLYDARDNGSTEADYETGMAQLAGILNNDQKADLQEMEQAYEARRHYASVYGFKCGLYGAFRQHFGQHTAQDGGFQDLVCGVLPGVYQALQRIGACSLETQYKISIPGSNEPGIFILWR